MQCFAIGRDGLFEPRGPLSRPPSLASAPDAAQRHHMMYYNFVRIHQTLRVTPAMAAGVTDRLWEIEDIVALLEAEEGPAKKRGPYKKRVPD